MYRKLYRLKTVKQHTNCLTEIILNPYLSQMRIFFIGLFLLNAAHLFGQQDVAIKDSLDGIFSESVEPTGSWDTWGTFVEGRSVNMQSLKAGVEFGGKMSLGLSYSWLSSNYAHEITLSNRIWQAQYELRYFGPYFDFEFFHRGRWVGSIPIQLGLGRSFLRYTDDQGNELKLNTAPVMVYEPAMSFRYNVANLIELGAGVGYRFMLKNNQSIGLPAASPNFVVMVSFVPEGWMELLGIDYPSHSKSK